MADTVHLVERVIPEVPVRQWVCSLPWRLRVLCGYDRRLCAKVEPGEDPRAALVRELEEELGIQCEVGAPVEVTFHAYSTKSVPLLFFLARRTASSAEPRALDVADVRWALPSELDAAQFPPADVAVLARVRELLGGS